MNLKAVAVVVAGGSGERMGSLEPKQYLLLKGIPILAHTLKHFESSPSIESVIVVVPPEDEEKFKVDIVIPHNLSKIRAIVPGGKKRQDSVWNGLLATDPDADVIVIHDGVRPLITAKTIEECIKLAAVKGAVIVGLPVHETIKTCSNEGIVVGTVPRDNLWIAQTPQAFRREIIMQAYTQALKNGIYGTDDASLVERIGFPIQIIRGESTNIKITTPYDLIHANLILSGLEKYHD
ncbi:MAG: 2-C-methyl-D-erythritol 4-phosphate cytidylyltransferase [Syntrophales bacterium]|nr:2-C-methyl-D-erythritol 4-phosphate cytidylyltransferase [Syntrophales bacterium]